MKFFIALLLCLLQVQMMAAPVYKVVNADGTISYTDKAPENQKIAKTLNFDDLPMTAVPDIGHTQNITARAAPGSQPRDVIFYATWCKHCSKALAYLQRTNRNIAKVDVDTAYGKASFKQAGGNGVPLILYQGQRIAGFSDESYDWMFKYAGQLKLQK
jgi:glutaredoxin